MPIYLPIAELSVDLFFLIGIGAAIGFISGLFGVGGGFLMTPLLLFSGVPAAVAVASVTAQVAASSTSGAISYFRKGGIDFKLAAYLVGGGVGGSIAAIGVLALLRQWGQVDFFIAISYVVLLGFVGSSMLFESVRAIIRARRKDYVPTPKPQGSSWLQRLPLRTQFPRSKLYISVIPVIGIGFCVGILGALLGLGGGFILVPALVYLLRVPGNVVIGTSLVHLLVVMLVTCVLQAVTNQSVDILLAFCLMVGSVVGAQFGASAGQTIKGEQLRALLALLILLIATRFGFSLFTMPADPFTVTTIGFGETL
ncbi:sulfite exporter TauE/SafE family protein [Devosia sp. WQ 349]|uniref:sulfite exporter TauE/SafE family protein n=1 Tax=Devosia sp. WQ 349K1 TaxID=2800329 RepID=UPI001906A38B|nr:sulfite exporter TauE/SafE family protein [Devosia sp. WQ 349K1]MBK1796134.1 sulfite exporter TauE/SafE family protein [Devosia sp. WQ 349K1]